MTNENDDLTRRDTSGDLDLRSAASADRKGSAHTPTPWEIVPYYDEDEVLEICAGYQDLGGGQSQADWIAELNADGGDVDRNIANAKFIVRACNSHADLLAACKGALAMESGRLMCLPTETDRECLNRVQRENRAALVAAIAKAEAVESATSVDARLTDSESGKTDGSATNSSSSEG